MPTSSTKIDNYAAARCIELAAVFQDQLLEEPLPASAPGVVRRRQLALIATAQTACRECPLIIDCLYRAVVEYDVAGFVAGTTPPQRAQIRRRLDITGGVRRLRQPRRSHASASPGQPQRGRTAAERQSA